MQGDSEMPLLQSRHERWRLDEGGQDGLGDTNILKTVFEVELTGLAIGHNVGGEGTRNHSTLATGLSQEGMGHC